MRYTPYLRSRYASIAHTLGRSLTVVGVLMLVPALVALAYPQELNTITPFLLLALGLMAVGSVLRAAPMKEGDPLTYQEGTAAIVLVWIITMVASTYPFLRLTELTFSQALLESVSGWTATGVTVVDVTDVPRTILFFRSWTQYVGAAGVAILVMSSLAGPSGIGLTAAEGRGTQTVPNVQRSARIVLQIYSAYAIGGILALWAAGMSFFDALIHSLSAVATGGFSTRPDSIGYFNNPTIEVIIMVLLFLGATSFLTAFAVLQGNFKQAARSSELRFSVALYAGLIVVLYVGAVRFVTPDVLSQARLAAFEAVSALSSGGFTLTDYRGWPDFGWLALIAAMVVGGGTESTAGGIKQLRILILLRSVGWEVRRAFLPEHIVNQSSYTTIEGDTYIDEARVRQVALFAVAYVVCLLLGTAAFTLFGYDLRESLFEVTSLLGTTGLSVGVVSPDMPPVLMWLGAAGMFLGRLEIFALVIGVGKLISDAPVVVLGGGEGH